MYFFLPHSCFHIFTLRLSFTPLLIPFFSTFPQKTLTGDSQRLCLWAGVISLDLFILCLTKNKSLFKGEEHLEVVYGIPKRAEAELKRQAQLNGCHIDGGSHGLTIEISSYNRLRKRNKIIEGERGFGTQHINKAPGGP